jgi:hypothetical protein
MRIMMSRTITALFALGFYVAPAQAQTLPAPLSNPDKPPIGSLCETPKRRGQGIIKVDLCGRLYCGSPSWIEPFQKRDYDRKRMPCEFKLVKDICRCVPEGTK